jgi:hypothetical protein
MIIKLCINMTGVRFGRHWLGHCWALKGWWSIAARKPWPYHRFFMRMAKQWILTLRSSWPLEPVPEEIKTNSRSLSMGERVVSRVSRIPAIGGGYTR